jgi:hypothetical protein
MKFVCGYCGKTYNTEAEAVKCETECKAKKEKDDNLRKVMDERRKKIISDIKDYERDYHSVPFYDYDNSTINVLGDTLSDLTHFMF